MKRSAWDISEGGNYSLSTQVLFPVPLLFSVGIILVLATFLQQSYDKLQESYSHKIICKSLIKNRRNIGLLTLR